MFSAAVDSNRSAPRPAQSPTLSPTRSAITAALRGSSSGMPASILPPGPTDIGRLGVDPAAELGEQGNEARAEPEAHDEERRDGRVREPAVGHEDAPHPERQRPDDEEPGYRPPRMATWTASTRLWRAAAAVRTFDRDVHPDHARRHGAQGADEERDRGHDPQLDPEDVGIRHLWRLDHADDDPDDERAHRPAGGW